MKPQTGAFLDKSREFLVKTQELLNAHHWFDEAGRAAYLAGFHAAQALLFEKSDKVVKTHKGVQAEFAKLTKDDPSFDIGMRTFLSRAYNLKAIADYETGPGSEVSPEQATKAGDEAKKFVAKVAAVLEGT